MTLKQQIWEAHPYMPRLNKLKMAKYLPIAFARVCTASRLLGLPTPERFWPKKCSLNNSLLSLHTEDGSMIATMDLDTLDLGLPNGQRLSQHSYWELSGESSDNGFYHECKCKLCIDARAAFEAHQVEHFSERLLAFSIPVKLPKEERIDSPSPELNTRLPKEYQVVKPVPVIVDYKPFSTDENLL